jgi:hypothetical protein
MIRSSIFLAVVLSLLGSGLSYASIRSDQIEKAHKARACHAKIGPKNLKGPALKSEWGKCMINPDFYT